MIAARESVGAHSSDQLPNSRRVYLPGRIYPDLRVPFREIALADTKALSGALEPNEPVRVYDTSGPWGDAEVAGEVREGLAPLRLPWILKRGDVEFYTGRDTAPQDNGYLSHEHEAQAASPEKVRGRLEFFSGRAASAVAGQPGAPGDPALVRAPRRHHAGDGVHRHPREPRARGRLPGRD